MSSSSESQRRRVGKVAMTVHQPWSHSLTSTTHSDGGRVMTWPGFKGWGRRREKPARGERKRSTTPSPGPVCQGQRQATTHLQQNATQRPVQGKRHHERRPDRQAARHPEAAYYRGTRLITTRRQQAVRGPGQQTAIADDSGAGRGPSGDAETGAARSNPRSPGRRGALFGFGRGRGSPGNQRDDTGADEQHEGVSESSPVPAGGHRPRTRLQTHSSSDNRPMMSDGRQTQGRIDTMFQRHQHQ